MSTMLSGLIFGTAFGFLLQRGRVLRYDKQVGALRLMDMTIVKFMFSAVLVGMVGVYALLDIGSARLVFLPAALGGNVIGGLLLGAGWAMVGYCPGTSLGALAEGRVDALWGILGMVAGAAAFAEFYPIARETVFGWGYIGAYTLPQVLGINHWIVVPVFVLGGLGLFRWLETKGY